MIAGLVASLLWGMLCARLVLATSDRVWNFAAEGRMVWARADEAIPGLKRNPGIDPLAMRALIPCIGFVQTRLRADSLTMQRWLKETDVELTAAGLQTAWDPVVALAYRLLGALITLAAGSLLVLALGPRAPMFALALLLPLYFFVGPYVFRHAFRNKAKTRVAEIERRLPYALEFVSMTMQANAMVHQALAEYVRSSSPSDPVAWEFKLVLRDQSLGLGARASFSNFARRVNSSAVRLFVSAVEHGIDNGQSMTAVLSEQAQAARVLRYQAAEALAKNAAIEAVVPMMLCLVSCMLGLVVPMLAKFNFSGM